MKITLLAVGRGKKAPEQQLMEHYFDRFNALGASLGLGPVQLIEVEEKRPIKGAERQRREAELLEKALPAGALRVALDERGKNPTSVEFSELLTRARDNGQSELVFMIGGADGFDRDFLATAQQKISFGRMTYPHMLVRALLAEQIYRAATILSGHPYHKD
ncbi:MAG: 23S rRNA (pseudouridine(1915)-N(3))-methyltransferase RlmH [Alphaproteobacteria bacterium]|nr:MAG: 23S rRNA (pseudouridine(1915)-N(3))-methyltransferase RlmH [Alphaproteobacteria bacterium]